ncbi:EthD domain-containing protein [Phenylobacterium sp. LjRoot225]|uniref:EthD domain-containing protein n=1 Tax=Phenylobacterium sp. LjRoot225 TaxID=3342285 RepID=UPI003ECE231D
MPIKLLVMVKRKPGLSPEAFREGYENGHARLAVELFGHLWTEYRRNYLRAAHSFVEGGGPTDGEQAADAGVGYDVVSELVFPDRAALDEMNRLALEHHDQLKQDEERYFDRPHCWMVACETLEEDLSARRGAPA